MGQSLKSVLIVFAGSGLGGVARYGMQAWIFKTYPFTFPLGTFVVNILGCFLIGLFYTLSEKTNFISPDWRLALTTGLCGGFTTFSTFGYENMNLLKTGNYLYFSLYIIASVVLGIAAVFGGIFITRYIL
ncbi:MAG TPA: fluoride efflux transporter CrcB [Panacibacter sp.]|nr:fluoride efflux transporter CrcB [Panacibacter sp.]